MSKVADAEMLQVFGRTDPEQAKRDKKHNDELQQILEDEFFAVTEEEYEWMRTGRTMLDLKEALETNPAPVVLYGASRGMVRAIKYLSHFNISPKYLCDRKGREPIDTLIKSHIPIPEDLYGFELISLDTLCSEHKASYILIDIVDPNIYMGAYYSLLSMGFPKEHLFATRLASTRGGGDGSL